MRFNYVPLNLPRVPGHGDTYKNIAVQMPSNMGGVDLGGGAIFGRVGGIINVLGANVYNPDKFGLGLGPLPNVGALNTDLISINNHGQPTTPAIVVGTGLNPLSGNIYGRKYQNTHTQDRH